MHSIKELLMALCIVFPIYVFSQTVVEVRVASVYSDVCDLDGFAAGDSDNYWSAKADDGGGLTGDYVYEHTANNPGQLNVNTTFFSETYASSPPSSIDISWDAFENDGTPGIPVPQAAGSGSITININYGVSAGVWHNTIVDTDAVSGFCTGDVNWRMTFQVRHDTPLPVEMIHFTCHPTQSQEIHLEWEVASELNNHGFEIERSVDGKLYTQIGFVPSKHSSGTGGFSTYQFMDRKPKENNFYRLRQVNFDGTFEYSTAILVELELTNSMQLFPNPFEEEITLRSQENESVEIFVYDLNGKVVEKINSTERTIKFGKSLPKGSYYIQVNRFHKSESFTIVKR